jgi:hypothetical protein
MEYRLRLIIIGVAFFCLSLAALAPASYTNKTLYIDGQYILQATGGDELTFNLGEIRILAEGNNDYIYNEYIGAMDEFAIYAGMLSVERIQAHYDAKDSGYAAAVQADNPLLWLRFEDESLLSEDICENWGSSVVDGEYYIVETVGPFTQVPGIDDSNAIKVSDSGNNAPGHKINVPDNGEFGSGLVPEGEGGQVTVELWVDYNDTGAMPGSDYPRFFTTAGGYGLHVNRQSTGDGNDLMIHGGSDSYVSLPFDLNDGEWHHIVITYESVVEPRIPKDTNSYFQEVNENNPILWLRFEDEDPCDYSGNNNWVDYGSAAEIVSGVPQAMGNCVKLDGSEGEDVFGVAAAKGPNSPPMDPNEAIGYEVFGDQYAFVPNDITIELWYKTFPADETQPGDFAYLFCQHGSYEAGPMDPNNEVIGPALGNSGGSFRVSGGSGLGYTGTNTKFNGMWHHIVVTYNEDFNGTSYEPNTMYAELFVDGLFRDETLFETQSATYIGRLGPELSHIIVGAENDIGNTYNVFPGYIDEFAIYEGILGTQSDPNQIEDHYWAWQADTCAEVWQRSGPEKEAAADADINHDCLIDFSDYASFASEWAFCNDPVRGAPECPPNW